MRDAGHVSDDPLAHRIGFVQPDWSAVLEGTQSYLPAVKVESDRLAIRLGIGSFGRHEEEHDRCCL